MHGATPHQDGVGRALHLGHEPQSGLDAEEVEQDILEKEEEEEQPPEIE